MEKEPTLKFELEKGEKVEKKVKPERERVGEEIQEIKKETPEEKEAELEKIREELRKVQEAEILEKNKREAMSATFRSLESRGKEEGESGEIWKELSIWGKEAKKRFWEVMFPVWKEQFWRAQKELETTLPPKDEVEQSIFWNGPNSYLQGLQGKVMDGFRSTGIAGIWPEDLDEKGSLAPEKRRAEITVVDRKEDRNLSDLCKWAGRLKDQFPDEEERAFHIAQRVFKRMGKNSLKIFKENDKMVKERKEVLLGNIEYGVCRHRTLLFQVLAGEADLDSSSVKAIVHDENIRGAHDYNELRLGNGEVVIVDVMHPPGGWSKKLFGKYFDEVDFREFKAKGGFPRFGSNRLPFRVYEDFSHRFRGGRLGVNGLRELLKTEEKENQ